MANDNNNNLIVIFFVTMVLLILIIGGTRLFLQSPEPVENLPPKKYESERAVITTLPVDLPSANVAHGEKLYMTCVACHGDKAQGDKNQDAPALNIQEPWYIVSQLKKFKNGIRGTNPKDPPGMRMRPMAMILGDEKEMKDVAAYISTLKPSTSELPPKTVDGDVKRGKGLYAMCSTCHGLNGQGNQALNSPSLIGQHDWYIFSQLQKFKEGMRGSDPKDVTGARMRPMALSLSNEQAQKDVTAYISTFKFPANKRASTD
jgi:cytochrome c553